MKSWGTHAFFARVFALALLWLVAHLNPAFAANTITVQGVMRDSNGDLVSDYTPVGGIKAVFYHATHCAAVVNGDTDLLGCAPAGAAGSEVIAGFRIKAGAFAVSIEPSAGTLANMAVTSLGWYIKIRGIFASGAPVGVLQRAVRTGDCFFRFSCKLFF